MEVKFGRRKKFSYDAIFFKIDDSTIKSHVPKNCIYFVKEVKLKVECLSTYLIFVTLSITALYNMIPDQKIEFV